MTRKKWSIFAIVQISGTLLGLAAVHSGQLSSALSILLLMPGMLISLPLFAPGSIGNSWPKWTFFAVPVIANTVILGLLTAVVSRFRRGA